MREETTADVLTQCWKLESLILAEGKKGLVQWVNPDSRNEGVVDVRQEAGYRCAQLGLRSFGSFLKNHVEPAQSRLQHWLMTPSPNHKGLLPGTLKLFCFWPAARQELQTALFEQQSSESEAMLEDAWCGNVHSCPGVSWTEGLGPTVPQETATKRGEQDSNCQ